MSHGTDELVMICLNAQILVVCFRCGAFHDGLVLHRHTCPGECVCERDRDRERKRERNGQRERETGEGRERENERERLSTRTRTCVCACVCVFMRACVRASQVLFLIFQNPSTVCQILSVYVYVCVRVRVCARVSGR